MDAKTHEFKVSYFPGTRVLKITSDGTEHSLVGDPVQCEALINMEIAGFMTQFFPRCPLCGNRLDFAERQIHARAGWHEAADGEITPAPVTFCCKCAKVLRVYLDDMNKTYPKRVRVRNTTCKGCPHWHSPGKVFEDLKGGTCDLENRDKPHADTPGCPINLPDLPPIPEHKYLKLSISEEEIYNATIQT